MSNEIAVTFGLNVRNPAGTTTGYSQTINRNLQLNQAALGANGEVAAVTTTATTYSFSNLATPGLIYLQNLDATNFVTYGALSGSTFVPLGKIKPGEIAFFRLDPDATFQMKADTASVNIWYYVLED